MTARFVAAVHDATAVEVHHTGFGVYPGDNDELFARSTC